MFSVVFGSLLTGYPSGGWALDLNAAYAQLKGELQSKGLPSSDISAAAGAAKQMLGLGASSTDVKNILLNLAGKGFKGADLGKLSGLVNELMKSGLPVKAAEGFIMQSIQKSGTGGAKGSEVISKIQTLVSQKKAQLDQLQSIAAQNRQDVDKAKKKLTSLLGH